MKQKLILFVSFLFWGIGVAFSQIKVTGIVVDEQDEPLSVRPSKSRETNQKGPLLTLMGSLKSRHHKMHSW